MRRLVAALLCLPALAQSSTPAFDMAVAQLKARVVRDGGSGLVVLAERTDVFGVRFRVQAVGTTFEEIDIRPWDESHRPIFSYAGKATDAVDGSGRLNEEPNTLFVAVYGPDFKPKATMKLPRRGEKPEVATVYIGTKAEAPK